MAKKTELRDYLAGLKKAKDDKRLALDNYNEACARCKAAFVPANPHPTEDDIRRLYEMCPSVKEYHRTHVLVCLVLVLYAPDALFGGRLPMRLAALTARVLGVKHEMVYISRNKVTAWLRLYPDFLSLVSGLYENALDI